MNNRLTPDGKVPPPEPKPSASASKPSPDDDDNNPLHVGTLFVNRLAYTLSKDESTDVNHVLIAARALARLQNAWPKIKLFDQVATYTRLVGAELTRRSQNGIYVGDLIRLIDLAQNTYGTCESGDIMNTAHQQLILCSILKSLGYMRIVNEAQGLVAFTPTDDLVAALREAVGKAGRIDDVDTVLYMVKLSVTFMLTTNGIQGKFTESEGGIMHQAMKDYMRELTKFPLDLSQPIPAE